MTDSGQTPYTGASLHRRARRDARRHQRPQRRLTAIAGTVSFSSPNLTWTGNLAPGETATITFSVTVTNPDTGDKILTSTITSTTAGSNCASGSPTRGAHGDRVRRGADDHHFSACHHRARLGGAVTADVDQRRADPYIGITAVTNRPT